MRFLPGRPRDGAHGIATFDPTVKPQLVSALKQDVPVLKSAGLVDDVDVDAFVDDQYVKRALGNGSYARRLKETAPAAKSELWQRGATATRSFASPDALLEAVAAAGPDKVRAAYVPDATTGTLWFADKAVWVPESGSGSGQQRGGQGEFKAFVTPAAASAYVDAHPGARTVSYRDALKSAGGGGS